MKLFNVSVIKSFSAKSVNQAVKSNKISSHQFTSLCGRFICELSITDSHDWAAFSYTVTFKCSETNAVISEDKRKATSIADLKDTFKTIIEAVNENNPELPATEDATEKHTISRVFGEHGYTKCKMDGFEVINDPEGREVCRVSGSLRTRLAYKWLIVDALVNGRDEQQNEDDFAALSVGDFFELTFENGGTVPAQKMDELQFVSKMFGRYTEILFQRRWLVTVNPVHKELFASFAIGTELKCGGDHFTVRSHTTGEEGEPRAGLVNAQGQVMSVSIESMLSEIKSGKTKRITHTDKFLSLPIGHPFACDLLSGQHIPEAIKSGEETITFNHYGKMKTVLFVPGMTCDPEWPTSPDYKLIQDPHNHAKQYILKRENFQEITVFQLVHGHQVSRAKFTESELLATYDFIYQYQLNKLLSGNCNSAYRLYAIKRDFLEGKPGDWRIDAKLLCINPDSLGFMAHVGRENELKPLALRTAEAMKKTCPGRGVKCWWCVPGIDRVLRDAERAGYVSRISTTQIGWTQAGVDALNAAKKLTFTFYTKAA